MTKSNYAWKQCVHKDFHISCAVKIIIFDFSAVELGISGLPSFQVDNGPIVFGQDRLNIVEDMLLGWKFDIGDFFNKSKL